MLAVLIHYWHVTDTHTNTDTHTMIAHTVLAQHRAVKTIIKNSID